MKKIVLILFFFLTTYFLSYFKEIGNTSGDSRFNQNIISVGFTTQDNYTSIQEAINAAENGSIINVKAGVYYENIIINKTVSLFGENKENTIIDGNGKKEHVVSIEACNAVLCNFTLRNSGFDSITPYSGLRLNFSHNNLISNNIIVNNQYGVWLSNSNNNIFINNKVINSTGTYGVRLSESKNNTISNNFIANNSYGIYVYGYSDANIIKNNNLTDNSYGLYIAYYSKLNQVEANNVYDSKSYGITLRNATNNFIFHNNFVNNHHQIDVIGVGTNIWHDEYPSGGNYWSDYKGKDQNSGVGQNISGCDGLGDEAYGYDINNLDMYPLMGFYNTFNIPWNSTIYQIAVVCNSTITGLSINSLETSLEIRLNVSEKEETWGFCRISIPQDFLENSKNYSVIVNGNASISIRELESYNGYSLIYFTFIQGPYVPEFTSTFIIFSTLFSASIICIYYKAHRKKKTRSNHF